MPAIQLSPAVYIRLGIRGLQFICSLIALSTIAAGFKTASADYFTDSQSFETTSLSTMLGSHSTNFGLLLTYTTMLYGLYQIVAVEVYRMVPPPQRLTSLIVDGAFALVLLICGIVLAVSDYVKHCDSYRVSLRCNNLKAGTVFVFIACGAFICSAALTFLGRDGPSPANQDPEAGEQIPYVQETTPKALSPMGGAAPSPSAKV